MVLCSLTALHVGGGFWRLCFYACPHPHVLCVLYLWCRGRDVALGEACSGMMAPVWSCAWYGVCRGVSTILSYIHFVLLYEFELGGYFALLSSSTS